MSRSRRPGTRTRAFVELHAATPQARQPCRSGNCALPGARRAGQDRGAPEGSLDAPKALPNSRTPERRERRVVTTPIEAETQLASTRLGSRRPAGESWFAKELHQLLWRLGFGPSRVYRLGMNAKSFKVPSRLRFLVRPNAISDIRDRSLATSAAATPTWPALRTLRPETPRPTACLREWESQQEVATVR